MPAKKSGKGKSGLGKGLDLLIPNVSDAISDTPEREVKSDMVVSINKVEPNRDQPRKYFDENTINELADSIRIYGIISPIIVQKNEKDDYYEIVAGERRWRAARLAGLTEVPVIIREFTQQQKEEISLIENIQREDLNSIEVARAYKVLMENNGYSQDKLAERVSKSRSAVANTLRLLNLHEDVQQMIIDGTLTSGHARALLALEDKDKQVEIAKRVIDKKLSVRDVEKLVKDPDRAERPKKPSPETLNLVFTDIENNLRAKLSAKVNVVAKDAEKGRIEIEYYSQEEFQLIIDKLMSV